ncbi:MAG TPA: CpsD/CapB family tyrosine-protein kinase [Actinomycetota bacterium]|jgi:capsular exopolysaccharide synthesis family protein
MPPARDRTSRAAPTLADYGRSIWRRKPIVLVALCGGLVLGMTLLPSALANRGTLKATVPLRVGQTASDAIAEQNPQAAEAGKAKDDNARDQLRDVAIARRVLDGLGPLRGDLDTDGLLKGLSHTPVAGTDKVDLDYVDRSGQRAVVVARSYARLWVARRNAEDERRVAVILRSFEAQLQRLQARIQELSDQVDHEGGTALVGGKAVRTAPRTATSNLLSLARDQYQALAGELNDVRQKQLVHGASTAVLGDPYLTTAVPPIGRPAALVIGLLLGLLVGVAAVLMVESAVPKVVTPEDVEAATELPVLATVARAGMRKGGIPVANAPFSLAAEGYRRVAAALLRHGLCDDVRVLAVTSADPGEGKSTLAVNLGLALARQGRQVLLVSSDLRRPGIDKLLGIQGQPGLAELLQGERHDVLSMFVSVADNLLVLPAGNPSRNPGELLVTDKLRQMLITLRTTDITVLLDTPPAHFSADALTLAGVADAAVLVVRSGVSRWTGTQQAAEGFRRDQVREVGAFLVGTRSLRPLGSLRYGYGYGDKGIVEAAQAGHRAYLPDLPGGANGSRPRERVGERR